MKKRVIVGLVAAAYVLGISAGMPANGSAAADPFVGSRTLTLYGDSNIKNGFNLDSRTADASVSTNDGFHYTAAVNGGVPSLSMVRSGNQLSLSPRPQGTAIHSYMLSGGAVGAFLLMEQGISDPEKIGIRLATWAREGKPIPYGEHDEFVWKMRRSDVDARVCSGPAR